MLITIRPSKISLWRNKEKIIANMDSPTDKDIMCQLSDYVLKLFIFRSMTIRLYLTISFYSLNSRGSSVSFQSVAAFLLPFYPFHSPPPPCLYKMSNKSRLLCVHYQYQYQYQHQYRGTSGTTRRRTHTHLLLTLVKPVPLRF